MEKIRVNKGGKVYEIKNIMPITSNILQIVFDSSIPQRFGDIEVYTSGGIRCSEMKGYDTVYRDEGQTVYLSNDGSIYAPPEDPEQLPQDPYVPSEQELLAAALASKKAEVSAACEQTIYHGISVTLSDGTVEHYSLTEHDQINLFGKQAQLAAGGERLEYHADGQPCRYYSANDMQEIIQAAMFHVSYHTTYCNALNMWIAGCQTAEEINQIFYGADVPAEYRSEVLETYLLQIAAMAEEDKDETVS